MDLLEVAGLAEIAADVARGIRRRRAGARQVDEGLGRQLDDAVVIDLAGRAQDQPLAAVVLAHVAADGLARQAADDLGRAQHRAAEGLVGKGAGLEVVEDDVVGRVLGLADLLQHDRALARQLALVEHRVLEDVGNDVEGERHVVRQHARVVGGVLARGIGVEMAADRFDLDGDVAGVAALRCP